MENLFRARYFCIMSELLCPYLTHDRNKWNFVGPLTELLDGDCWPGEGGVARSDLDCHDHLPFMVFDPIPMP